MIEDRIISKFLHRSVEWNGCLLFLLDLDRDGYGVFRQQIDGKRRKFKAHRVVWEWYHGQIPGGMVVMHSCDNRPCVNIEHLSLGTQADNLHDMTERGRSRNAFGQRVIQPYMACPAPDSAR